MRHFPYRDRRDAGRRLAEDLGPWAGKLEFVVLALPRGGVPVACEVARILRAPLDVLVVRKLGVPGRDQLAMGAIASGGVRVVSQDIVRRLGLTQADVERVAAREQRELARREQAYRGTRAAPDLTGRSVILIDDGLATGASMRAALHALKAQEPGATVVAVPVGSVDTCRMLGDEADEVICLRMPARFLAVGQAYVDFSPTTDEEVRAVLQSERSGVSVKSPHPV